MPLLLRGDARALPLPDDSVDLVVTSPPYFGLRSYSDDGEHYDGQIGSEPTPVEFLDALIACTAEMARVLKPAGSIWVNLGDKYSTGHSGESGLASWSSANARGGVHSEDRAKQRGHRVPGTRPKSLLLIPERYRIRCVDELGLIARATVIWSKPNGLPESVTDRVRRSHEDWVHLTLAPHYYSAVDEIREPASDRTLREQHLDGQIGRAYRVRQNDGGGNAGSSSRGNPLGKLPGSVWEIPTQPFKVPASLGVDHFAAFPMEWPRRIIKGWSPPDGVVLDPFSGTGTTALVATMLGRRGIGVDMSADYCRLAQWRAWYPKERARAAGLDPDRISAITPESAGQFDLFDGEAS